MTCREAHGTGGVVAVLMRQGDADEAGEIETHALGALVQLAQAEPGVEHQHRALALDREGVPHTEFKYSEDTGQFAVIREQAGTFSDSIRLWSNA